MLEALRAAGLSPVAEDDVGGVLDLRPAGRRTAARRPERAVGTTPTLSDDQITALVAQLRAGDRAASAARGRGATGNPTRSATTSATVAVLAEAARSGRSVWIGYVDAHGTASQRVVRPLRVGGGVLEGVEDTDDTDDGETNGAVIGGSPRCPSPCTASPRSASSPTARSRSVAANGRCATASMTCAKCPRMEPSPSGPRRRCHCDLRNRQRNAAERW